MQRIWLWQDGPKLLLFEPQIEQGAFLERKSLYLWYSCCAQVQEKGIFEAVEKLNLKIFQLFADQILSRYQWTHPHCSFSKKQKGELDIFDMLLGEICSQGWKKKLEEWFFWWFVVTFFSSFGGIPN